MAITTKSSTNVKPRMLRFCCRQQPTDWPGYQDRKEPLTAIVDGLAVVMLIRFQCKRRPRWVTSFRDGPFSLRRHLLSDYQLQQISTNHIPTGCDTQAAATLRFGFLSYQRSCKKTAACCASRRPLELHIFKGHPKPFGAQTRRLMPSRHRPAAANRPMVAGSGVTATLSK